MSINFKGVTDGIPIPIKELVHKAAADTVKAAGITPQSSNASQLLGSLKTPMSTPDFDRALRVTEYNIKLRVQSTKAGGISQNSHEILLKIVEAEIILL